jgi:hypothetical protein
MGTLLLVVMGVGDARTGISRGLTPLQYLPGITRSLPSPTAPKVTEIEFSELLHRVARETRLYRLRDNPRVYLVDFGSLHEQAQTLNRVASLIEKKGMPDNRVIHQSELENYFKTNHLNPDTFYFGHNYRADDLAEFFTMVQRDRLDLNSQEQRFLQMLRDLGVLIQQRGIYKVPDPPRVVVTFTQTQRDNPRSPELDFVNMSIRCTVLRHELSHGEYSTNSSYRRLTHNFWYRTMTEQDRTAFRAFLGSKGYDEHNDELMANEMQAYLMHSPNPRAFSPKRVGLSAARVKELRDQFLSQPTDSWILQAFYPKGRVSARRRADLHCDF